jgi:hypothetical protein
VRVAGIFTITLALALAAACGRSSPDPCRAREGLTCDTLAAERALEEADFLAAVAAADGDAISAEGECVQAIVAEQLERFCIDDPCAELCELHPCALRGEGACAAQCERIAADNAIPGAALEAALVRAADRPGFCSCAVCDDATRALCDELWLCSVEDGVEG